MLQVQIALGSRRAQTDLHQVSKILANSDRVEIPKSPDTSGPDSATSSRRPLAMVDEPVKKRGVVAIPIREYERVTNSHIANL